MERDYPSGNFQTELKLDQLQMVSKVDGPYAGLSVMSTVMLPGHWGGTRGNGDGDPTRTATHPTEDLQVDQPD